MQLLGYEVTAVIYSSFILMLAFLFLERKGIGDLLRKHIDRYSILALIVILLFFAAFSILWVSPTEQLYFDENIYQGIAINILRNGNALWCQYGTGYLSNCYVNEVYHDPVGWSAFIAIAFAIFGIGFGTAYNLELFVGILSIVAIFLLSSLLINRKSFAILSTSAFALMPQLFIWSRTQADIDLPFMMLSIFAFFFFLAFIKRKSIYSFGLFVFSLDLVAYMRIEAFLLILVFAVLLLIFGEEGVRQTLSERKKQLMKALENTKLLLVLLAFLFLLLPEVYYIGIEASNPSYGQPANQSILSFGNFKVNAVTNTLFLFGALNGMNSTNSYPIEFHPLIMSVAVLGVLFFFFDRRRGQVCSPAASWTVVCLHTSYSTRLSTLALRLSELTQGSCSSSCQLRQCSLRWA